MEKPVGTQYAVLKVPVIHVRLFEQVERTWDLKPLEI